MLAQVAVNRRFTQMKVDEVNRLCKPIVTFFVNLSLCHVEAGKGMN